MRLAFAVAAHLEPEILIVDEVLAVGDSQFQKKCLGKMADVSKQGRTIVFVSHNMSSLRQLCSRGIILVDGKITYSGEISKAISEYENSPVGTIEIANQSDDFNIFRIEIKDSKGKINREFKYNEDLEIEVSYKNNKYRDMDISFGFESDNLNERVILLKSKYHLNKIKISKQGKIKLKINNLQLINGNYWVTIFAESNGKVISWLKKIASINIINNKDLFDYPKSGEAVYLPNFKITSVD